MSKMSDRAEQGRRLIDCAEAAIEANGLAGVRARELASCVGCSVGAIYNLVADLDELVLLVGRRTMADLNAQLDATARHGDDEAQFVAWALAYAGFATTNRNRWRALFEFRMAPGKDFPDWFEADQMALFTRLERRLSGLAPTLDAATLRLRARTLFSAVHGIVALGIEGKLAALPAEAIEAELVAFVRTYVAGLRLRAPTTSAQ